MSLDGEIRARAPGAVGSGRTWEGCGSAEHQSRVPMEGRASPKAWAEGTQGKQWLLHPYLGQGSQFGVSFWH